MAASAGPASVAFKDTVCLFTTSGSFVPQFSGTVEVLVVAGGGAGGNGTAFGYESGGGGGGGLIYNSAFSVTPGTSYTVLVGAGGASRTSTENGLNGGNSSFGALTAIGGGGGASSASGSSVGSTGGSGGGGSHNVGAGGGATAGQGFAGATPAQGSSGGGGGGAGTAGRSTSGNADGRGGDGLPFSISGSLQYYAGGGGGSRHSNVSGGLGGGGNGVGFGYESGASGTPNTGGGGGGANQPATNTGGGAGGSGIVIVRFSSSLGNAVATNGNIIKADNLIMHLDAANQKSILNTVEVLVVAGGGGSGGGGNTGYHGGGGGGGGVVYSNFRSITPSSAITVTVGDGGSAGTQSGDAGFRGGNGGNSSFGSLIANGGGGGGGNSEAGGANGGSGGGGNLYAGAAGITNQPTYIDALVFGNNGGSGQATYGSAGGGGGAGTAGTAGIANTGGQGGQGITSNITGSAVFYGGGGGGAGNTLNATAINGSTAAYVAGSPNTGQGGGGRQSTPGLSGGSGIVVVRYLGSQRATGGTVTTVGGYTIHTFTTSGTFTPLWGDATGRGNNGTLTGGPTYNSSNGGSLVFDGTDDYISCGTFFNYTNFTISLWVYPGSTQTTYADIFDNNHTGGQNFVCQQNATNTNQYDFACINATNFSATSLFNLTANIWQYLTFTWNNSIASAYINGVFHSSGSAANPINYSNPNLSIARWSNGGRNWNGRISNFVAYNKALTATEIQQNFNATRGRFGI